MKNKDIAVEVISAIDPEMGRKYEAQYKATSSQNKINNVSKKPKREH